MHSHVKKLVNSNPRKRTTAITRRGHTNQGKSAVDIRCLHNFFHSKYITRKCLTLKIKVKIIKYITGPIRWQISNAIKVIVEHFLLDLTIFQIFTFKISRPWKCRSNPWCTTFAVVSFDGKYLTSYLMAIVMFAFFPADTWQNSQLKSLILKIYITVIDYNIISYAIWWQISTSKKL